MTAAGAIIEYISPAYQPAGVDMSTSPRKLMNSSGIRAIISLMLSWMGTKSGPSTTPMKPTTPPTSSAVGSRSATLLVKVLARARR